MMKILIVLIMFPLILGCSTIEGVSTITETTSGVEFEASGPVKMTMKKEGVEYTYDSQKESILGKIVSVLTMGLVVSK